MVLFVRIIIKDSTLLSRSVHQLQPGCLGCGVLGVAPAWRGGRGEGHLRHLDHALFIIYILTNSATTWCGAGSPGSVPGREPKLVPGSEFW